MGFGEASVGRLRLRNWQVFFLETGTLQHVAVNVNSGVLVLTVKEGMNETECGGSYL